MHAPKPRRVLLVDDNQDFLNVARRFLRNLPEVELVGEATSGEQALELTAALHPQIVLLDIEMRGMTGVAATVRIKQQPHPPKVVVMTIHSQPEYRLLANKAGADGFVRKDHLFEELPRLLAPLSPDSAPLSDVHGGAD